MPKRVHKYQSANTVCRDAGHDWMTTAAANWRTCRRENCRASERLVDGQWVSNAKLYRQHTPVVASRSRQHQPRQSVMWD
jgi:hypothetical protein